MKTNEEHTMKRSRSLLILGAITLLCGCGGKAPAEREPVVRPVKVMVVGGEAEIGFDWEGNGTFFATALDFDGEYHYSGVDGWEYIKVDNESVAWQNGVDDRILLVEAGDQYHELLPLSQVDGGNRVKAEVTISGYFLRFGP